MPLPLGEGSLVRAGRFELPMTPGFKLGRSRRFATPANWCRWSDSNDHCPRFEGGDSCRLVCMGEIGAPRGIRTPILLLLRELPLPIGLPAHGAMTRDRTLICSLPKSRPAIERSRRKWCPRRRFERASSRLQGGGFADLSYEGMELVAGLEPATSSLRRRRSAR